MDKVWVASLAADLKPEQLEVFDNESDARNFAMEMGAAGRGKYEVIETPMNTRSERIEREPHWVDLANINAPCIECLMEDFSAMKGKPVNEKECAEFLEKHKEELQKKSDEIVHEYLKKAIADYVDNERIVLG